MCQQWQTFAHSSTPTKVPPPREECRRIPPSRIALYYYYLPTISLPEATTTTTEFTLCKFFISPLAIGWLVVLFLLLLWFHWARNSVALNSWHISRALGNATLRWLCLCLYCCQGMDVTIRYWSLRHSFWDCIEQKDKEPCTQRTSTL